MAYAPGEPLSVEDIQVRVGVSSSLIPKVYDVRGLKDAAAKARTSQDPLRAASSANLVCAEMVLSD